MPKNSTRLSPATQDRFGGVARLYGQTHLECLNRSHICIVGLGGVGSWSAEALARSGVGALTLIDLDEVCVSNTNRQLVALKSTLGHSKAQVLAKRLTDINPELHIQAIEDFVTLDNVQDIVGKEIHGVIDAIDSVISKAALLACCKRRKQLVVSCGGAGAQIDPTLIQVSDLNKSWNDPLLSKTRSLLRRQYGFSSNPKRHYGIAAIYSVEQLRFAQSDGSISQTKPSHADGARFDCQGGLGASCMVTGSFGFIAASQLITRLLTKFA